ncbi:dTTP/UTP pyrophosphatase [Alphaproteobacteria bacterium]
MTKELYQPRLILGSSSDFRVKLLAQIGYVPNEIYSPDIDESVRRGELPNKLAARLALEKAQRVRDVFPNDIVLAADTVAACGRLTLPKAMTEEEARFCLSKLSGRRHRVYTGVCGIYKDRIIHKLGQTRVKFKRFSEQEIELFINSKQWYAKAGGYGIQGLAACFVSWLSGSDISNIAGLPLYETYLILSSFGIYPSFR